MAKACWLDERQAHLWRTRLRVNQELPGVLAELLNQESGLSAADYAVLVPTVRVAGRHGASPRSRPRDLLGPQSPVPPGPSHGQPRLVAREEWEADARGAMIRLTPAGRAPIEVAAPGHVAATREHFFDPMPVKEIDVLTNVFERVLDHLGCGTRSAGGPSSPSTSTK